MGDRPVWCGACGFWDRPVTPEEAERTIRQAVTFMDEGDDPIQALMFVGWVAERHIRCGISLCQCRPTKARPWSDAPRRGYHLYRLWGEAERLLYVGVSTCLEDRLRSHHRRWGDLIERVTWEEHADAPSMLAAEREAIRNEDPAFNVAGVS